MPSDPWIQSPLLLIAALLANVAICEWLERRTPLRHLGAAMLVIVLTAIEANLGIVPTYSPDVVVYGGIFDFVVDLGIFWLLLMVDLRRILAAGGPMLGLFLVGSLGTALGAWLGMTWIDGAAVFGDLAGPIGGMFTATYTGGSVNFNALARHYEVHEHGVLYAGANAVDASMNAIWIVINVALPRMLRRVWPKPRGNRDSAPRSIEPNVTARDATVAGTALTLAAGFAAIVAAKSGAEWLASVGLPIPSVLLLTSIALVIAQTPLVRKLDGVRTLGVLAIHLFLCVIGALCDFRAVAEIGDVAVSLTILVGVIFVMHGAFTFGAAALLRWDADTAAVASQANIGGGGTALSVANSLGRPDLVVPGILVGSLGTALGTFLGFTVARLLGA